jgi:hypothetical protein
VVDNTDQRSLPPNSPILEGVITPNIPSPHLSPRIDPMVQGDGGVSSLLGGLNVDNLDRDQTILAHAQSIANLETRARRSDKIIRQNDATIKELQQLLVYASDINKLKVQHPKDLEQMRNSIDATLGPVLMRLSQLEHRPAPAQSYTEPPFFSHIYFSGELAETHRFCCFVRDTFARLPGHFSSKRQKNLWIAAYFRSASGNLGDPCHSYTWWRGLLSRNAHEQHLPVKNASSASAFVIEELYDAEVFLSHLEDIFSNHKEDEEARRALLSLKQGNQSIAEFNIHFNTLLYLVELSEASKCEVYKGAINH